MCIYRPKVVEKKVPSRHCHQEHGAEIIYLDEDDYLKEETDPEYFKVVLGYNGIHHYVPIVPKYIVEYLEACDHLHYYTRGARDSLKIIMSHLPKDSNFYKLAKCAHEASVCTTTVLSGINILTGATGTTGAATAADIFGFPSSGQPASKRKRIAAPVGPQLVAEESGAGASSSTGNVPETQEEQVQQTFQIPEDDPSPEITIKKHGELKHGADQCFCGKSGLVTAKDKDDHYKAAHFQKGSGLNPKTKKKKDLWACSTCKQVCKDNRAVWKHYRTQHLGWFIHYCPVDGCNTGNDQKDTIVSHILKDHKNEEEWVVKAYAQKWLICPTCHKFFHSVKGKNAHVPTCGEPKIRINCPYEHCYKTYRSEEALDSHIDTCHKGKAHKCLCPHCGQQLSSKQNLDRHIAKDHCPKE